MNHHHHHSHTSHAKVLHGALWVAVLFMGIEVIGGWLANSLALISEALHLFTDIGALLLALIVSKIAHRPTTPSMSYGYHRAEVLGALVNAASLWALCGVLIYEAVLRFFEPEIVQGPVVFVIACFGLVANFTMLKILHPSHAHSLNVRAAYLHVIGDLLASIGVLLSGIIIWISGWNFVDPIMTLLLAVFILKSSGKVIRETISILMESTPAGINPEDVQATLQTIEGVKEVHDLHIWTASLHKIALSVHLIAENPSQVLSKAHHLLETKHGIRHMTIQVEDPKTFEPRYCYDCQNNL